MSIKSTLNVEVTSRVAELLSIEGIPKDLHSSLDWFFKHNEKWQKREIEDYTELLGHTRYRASIQGRLDKIPETVHIEGSTKLEGYRTKAEVLGFGLEVIMGYVISSKVRSIFFKY